MPQVRKAALAKLLKRAGGGIDLVGHMEGDGATIFEHACKLGFEGFVSKHREHPYRSGPSKAWLKVKNPAAPAWSASRIEAEHAPPHARAVAHPAAGAPDSRSARRLPR